MKIATKKNKKRIESRRVKTAPEEEFRRVEEFEQKPQLTTN